MRYHEKGSLPAKSKLYTEHLHVIDDHLRYLGPQLEEGGTCQVEVTIQIQEEDKLAVETDDLQNMIMSTLM